MPAKISAFLSLFLAVVGPLSAGEQGAAYRQLQGAANGRESLAISPEGAVTAGRQAFDEPINPALFEAPKAKEPQARAQLAPGGDFVVGKPQNMREPKNPLTREDKPKGHGSGWLVKIIGAVLGGLLCGVLGFFVGGPIGAAAGFAAGAIGGWMVTH